VPTGRDHDLVLFGATGFTGALTADYLARRAPAGCRWALAGRDRDRLAAVRARLTAVEPALAELPLLVADATDAGSLRAVAESARVVVTTVGPYLRYGAPLVAACSAAGTDYVDLTGEPEFVDKMYVDHHDEAVATGARLVHSAGFDSVPHDLGALLTVRELPSDVPLTVRGVVRTNAGMSGGTLSSALEQMSRTGSAKAAARARRAVEPRPEGRRVRAVKGRPMRDDRSGLWLLPLPTIDPLVVRRSAAALPEYGPDFSYTHYAGVRTLRGVVVGVGTVAGVVAAAQVPPARAWLRSRLAAGSGPDQRRRDRSWFTVDLVGEGGGRRVITRVRGGDPGYTETAKMLSETALSLAYDDNPPTAGQLTTAVAAGANLVARLVRAGMEMSVIEVGDAVMDGPRSRPYP
jgi:saccharopine dehydrogenase (NAD+, L-glutamate forming)